MKIYNYLILTNLILSIPKYTSNTISKKELEQIKLKQLQEKNNNETQDNNKTFNKQTQNKNIETQDKNKQTQDNKIDPNSGITTKATFYFRVGPDVEGCPNVQTFNDGNSYGPCRSEDGSQGVKYTENSKYWAAISNAASRCGDTITVTYNGNSIKLKIMDECPACKEDNHVDMSLDALIELTGSKENACAINKGLPMITWY
jgi:hypothetical protein